MNKPNWEHLLRMFKMEVITMIPHLTDDERKFVHEWFFGITPKEVTMTDKVDHNGVHHYDGIWPGQGACGCAYCAHQYPDYMWQHEWVHVDDNVRVTGNQIQYIDDGVVWGDDIIPAAQMYSVGLQNWIEDLKVQADFTKRTGLEEPF